MTLPGDAISKEVMSKGAAAAGKRKWESPEAEATPRKKRKRGRRKARRVIRACVGLTSDLSVDVASCTQDLTEALKHDANETGTLSDDGSIAECSPEDENTGCHFLCRRNHCLCHNTNDRGGTFSRNTTDKPDNCCRCDDRRGGAANDCSQFSFSPSGEKSFSDRHTCNTPHEKPDSSICRAADEDQNNSSDDNATNFKSDKDKNSSPDRVDDLPSANGGDEPTCNTMDTPVDLLSTDTLTCSTNDTHVDRCRCKNKHTEGEKIFTDCDFGKDSDETTGFCGETTPRSDAGNAADDCNRCRNCKTNDACNHSCGYNHTNKKSGRSEEDKTPQQGHIQHPSDAAADYRTRGGVGRSNGNVVDVISNHLADCNVVDDRSGRKGRKDAAHTKQRGEERDEEKQTERMMKVKEKREEWEKEWVRRKEKEREEKERERRKEVDFYAEKRPCFPHALPPPCIPLHAPLLLPHSFTSSSSSSSFSFHHTIIQHHLSLLPPPPHLPVPSYPQLLPSFSPHLCPLALNPPPAPPPPPPPVPPSFYTSSPISLLDAPGPYPMGTAFHPVQSHHPSLYPPPHPAVLPLQVLF